MNASANRVVTSLLAEDEFDDFDLEAEIDGLTPAECWVVCAEPADAWPRWVYVVVPGLSSKNRVGTVVDPESAVGQKVVQAAVEDGLNPEYTPYVSVVRKITYREYRDGKLDHSSSR